MVHYASALIQHAAGAHSSGNNPNIFALHVRSDVDVENRSVGIGEHLHGPVAVTPVAHTTDSQSQADWFGVQVLPCFRVLGDIRTREVQFSLLVHCLTPS